MRGGGAQCVVPTWVLRPVSSVLHLATSETPPSPYLVQRHTQAVYMSAMRILTIALSQAAKASPVNQSIISSHSSTNGRRQVPTVLLA